MLKLVARKVAKPRHCFETVDTRFYNAFMQGKERHGQNKNVMGGNLEHGVP